MTRAKTLSTVRNVPARMQGLAQRRARRTDILDPNPRRRPVVSPVTAPLIFRRAADKGAAPPDHSEAAERLAAKQAKRSYEDDLWKAFHKRGGDDARNALWVHYQNLVRYIAERLKTKLPECVDVQDLISAGNLGLQDAINKFDPKVGVRFETYCVPRIRGAILDSIRAADWVPRLIRNKNHQFERLVRELAAQFGREPTDEEIAKRLRMDLKRFRKLRKELEVKSQISLEGGAHEDADPRDAMRLEMMEDRDPIEPTRNLQREEVRAMALRGLHSSERYVVEQYYFEGRSMKQIGEELALSESRICQIHAQVLEVLRKKFRAYQDSCGF